MRLMEYMLRRRPFDESLLSGSVRAIERIVDEDEAVSAVADALRDFGLADDEDGSEFLILAPTVEIALNSVNCSA